MFGLFLLAWWAKTWKWMKSDWIDFCDFDRLNSNLKFNLILQLLKFLIRSIKYNNHVISMIFWMLTNDLSFLYSNPSSNCVPPQVIANCVPTNRKPWRTKSGSRGGFVKRSLWRRKWETQRATWRFSLDWIFEDEENEKWILWWGAFWILQWLCEVIWIWFIFERIEPTIVIWIWISWWS